MDFFGILAIILAVVGIVGGFLPMLPGPPLSWVALLLVFLSDKADPVTVTALVGWLVAAVVITVADYILPGYMTRLTGGHKAAERGAFWGLIAGIVFTPVGMVLGSFLGAFICEMIASKKDMWGSLKAATGAFAAFILSTGIKVIYSAVILWVVVVAVI